MFSPDFDPAATLATVNCPRCHHLGLRKSDEDAYRSAPPEDRVKPTRYIDPSVYAQCPACRSVMEWPSCMPG